MLFSSVRFEGAMLIGWSSFGAVCERATANAVIAFFFPGEEFTTEWL
jgi:hypothetical protein